MMVSAPITDLGLYAQVKKKGCASFALLLYCLDVSAPRPSGSVLSSRYSTGTGIGNK